MHVRGRQQRRDTATTDIIDEEDPFDIAGESGLRDILGSLYTGVGAVTDVSDQVLSSSADPESGNSETRGKLINISNSQGGSNVLQESRTWTETVDEMEQELADLRRQVEQLRAEQARANQRDAARPVVPNSAGGTVRKVQGSRSVPMFKGKDDEL